MLPPGRVSVAGVCTETHVYWRAQSPAPGTWCISVSESFQWLFGDTEVGVGVYQSGDDYHNDHLEEHSERARATEVDGEGPS